MFPVWECVFFKEFDGMNTEIWAKFKARVKNQVNDGFYHAYLENLSCRSMTDTEWEVCLPDRATLNEVESKLSEKFLDIIHELLKDEGIVSEVSLVFSLEGDASDEQKAHEPGYLPLMGMNKVTDVSTPEDVKAAFRVSPKYSVFDTADAVRIREESHLNANYTFDSFIKGGSNEMAYCAAKAVAASPSGAYNPLFIYGGVGLGKTHLMHAIGNEILQTSNLRVRYMTSEEFTNGYLESLASGKMKEFRIQVRQNCDVLLLDDIQFVAGKKETQNEFFNVFNELTQNNKQIVLTSDRSPKEIKELTDRMQSRFMQGLMADIQLPEFETRLEIVRKKSRAERFFIPDDIAQYIASNVKSNVRELEGCINRIKMAANSHEITMALAQRIIEPFYQPHAVLVDANMIIETVCKYFGIAVEEMMGKSRAKPIAHPRQIAMYLARSHTSLSFPDLERIFERDHTTVLYAVRKIKDGLANKDSYLEMDIKRLEDELFKNSK